MALRKSNNKYQTGWNNAIDFYTKNGYTTAELYAVTWGSGSVNKDRVTADMSCQLVTRVRRYAISHSNILLEVQGLLKLL